MGPAVTLPIRDGPSRAVIRDKIRGLVWERGSERDLKKGSFVYGTLRLSRLMCGSCMAEALALALFG